MDMCPELLFVAVKQLHIIRRFGGLNNAGTAFLGRYTYVAQQEKRKQ